MPVSERARRQWWNATGAMRAQWAKEAAAQFRERYEPNVAQALYPRHPTTTQPRPKARAKQQTPEPPSAATAMYGHLRRSGR